MMHAVLAAVAVLVAPLAVWAAPVRVSVDTPGHLAGPFVVVATPLGQSAESPSAPVRWPVARGSAGGELTTGLWRLELEGPAAWSAGAEVFVAPDGPALDARLEVWEAASIVGELEEPREGTAWLTSSGTGPGPDARVVPRTETACEIHERRFRCSVAAARLDLRIGVDGRVPRYLWGIEALPQRDTTIGRHVLPLGASISGFVHDARRQAAAQQRVTLGRLGDDRGVIGSETPAPQPSAVTDARGFFQILNPPLGRGALSAHTGDGREARVAVSVLEGRESALLAPMVLSETASLTLVFSPEAAPDGSPWEISLNTVGANPMPLVAQAIVSRDGIWRRPATPVGRYDLRVVGGTARWHRGEIEHAPGGKPIDVDLSGRPIQGTVRIGGERLEARLTIGGGHGPIRVPLESDEDGRFEGLVPQALTVADILVESRQPPIRRLVPQVSLADGDIELVLPATSLSGVLVTETGAPVKHAVLSLEPEPEGALQQRVVRDEEGRFQIDGLAVGKYRLTADTNGLTSDELPVEVAEYPDPSKDVRVVMRSTRGLRLRVIGPDGQSVPGARVRAQPAERPLASAPVMATDASGRVELVIPPGTHRLGFTVDAPGFAHHISTLPMPADGDEAVVSLGRASGALDVALEGGPGGDDEFGILIRQGWFESVGLLQYFTRATPSDGADGRRTWQFEGLAPGRYTLCRVRTAELPATLEAGARKRCDSGVLHAGASLSLTVK